MHKAKSLDAYGKSVGKPRQSGTPLKDYPRYPKRYRGDSCFEYSLHSSSRRPDGGDCPVLVFFIFPSPCSEQRADPYKSGQRPLAQCRYGDIVLRDNSIQAYPRAKWSFFQASTNPPSPISFEPFRRRKIKREVRCHLATDRRTMHIDQGNVPVRLDAR